MNKLRLSGLALVIIMMAGCNDSSSQDDDDSAQSDEDSSSSTITIASFAADGDVLSSVISDFKASTGFTVDVREYIDESEAGEVQAIRDGESADIVVLPQPSRIHELREEGLIEPLRPELYDTIKDNSMTAYVADNSQAYGLPYAFSVKSIVWYSRSVFDEADLNPPARDDSWEDFIAAVNGATDTDDNDVPDHSWCIGMENDAISAGDWFEEFMLQTQGVDTYNQWANDESGFQYQDYEGMLDDWKEIILDHAQDNLAGLDPFWSAPRGILADERDCFLHSQASWIVYAFDGHLATSDDDGDIDFFAFPILEDRDYALRRIGGEYLVKVNDVEGVDEFLSYVWEESSRASVASAGGGKLPANTGGDDVIAAIEEDYILNKLSDWYLDNMGNGVGIEDIEVFDGTDLLPVEFAEELEEALKDFATGESNASETVNKLEDARP